MCVNSRAIAISQLLAFNSLQIMSGYNGGGVVFRMVQQQKVKSELSICHKIRNIEAMK